MTGGILVNRHKSFEHNSNMFLTFPKGEQKSNPLLFRVMLNLFFLVCTTRELFHLLS